MGSNRSNAFIVRYDLIRTIRTKVRSTVKNDEFHGHSSQNFCEKQRKAQNPMRETYVKRFYSFIDGIVIQLLAGDHSLHNVLR